MSDVIDRAHQAAWTAWAADEGTVLQIDVYASAAMVELLEHLLSDASARHQPYVRLPDLRRLLEEVQGSGESGDDGPCACSGADYHLPACGGTCGTG
jgi:hypothetical protein